MKIAARLLTVVALILLGTTIYFSGVVRQLRAQVAAIQADDTRAQFPALEVRVAAAMQRAKATDDENARLLQVLKDLRQAAAAKAAEVAASPALTRDSVQARYQLGQELARSGDAAGALRELLWCYDEGMVRISVLSGVRTNIPRLLANLGKTHPPALAALIERRDRLEREILAGDRDFGTAQNLGNFNKALGQDERTMALFEKLPAGDRRREGLTSVVSDRLIAARRYSEVAEVRTLARMTSSFDPVTLLSPLPAGMANPERIQAARRASFVARVAKDIEVLAGLGDVASARVFAQKLLAFDNTPETRALVQEHATRAGHPRLLAEVASP